MIVALERWADEAAVTAAPDGRRCLHDALLRVTASMVEVELAAFSFADTVPERLEALETPLPALEVRSLGLLFTPGFVLGAASVAGLGAWIANLQMLFRMAGRCPL